MLWLRERGIDTVLTDGMFESNRRDRTTRHPEAATSPDGKVFISSEATLSEAELSRHEAVHVLEMKGNPLYNDYYEDLQSRLLRTSDEYRKIAEKINDQYYDGKLDIEDIDSVYPISRELFAYVHQFIQTDPTWASERFSGAFSDWDGVVEASRRLAQGLENQGAAGDAQGNGNPSRKEPAEVRGEFSRLYAPDSGTSERLQAMAAGYDADTAEAFAAGYDGTLPLTSYQTAFDYFRTQAKQGIPLETAEKNGGLLGQLLAPESRRIAYQAGLRESAARGMMSTPSEEENAETGNTVITDGSHIRNGRLKPNITYLSGENNYIYKTNQKGLITNAHTDNLQLKKHDGRLTHKNNTYGKLAGDHAGHLFGDRFGGSPKLDNLVSQAQRVNLSEYKVLENQWVSALKEDKNVSVDIEIYYDNDNSRPTKFKVCYKIDGIKYICMITN